MPQGSRRISSPFVLGQVILFELVELGELVRLPEFPPEVKGLVPRGGGGSGSRVRSRRTTRWRQVPALGRRDPQLRRAQRAPSKRLKILLDCFLEAQIELMEEKKFCKRWPKFS